MGAGKSKSPEPKKRDLATELIDINYADECAEEQYI
jgi:hypothetical protein